MAKKITVPPLDPMQVLNIVTIVSMFLAQVAINVVGKTGDELTEGIVKSAKAILPSVEALVGRDLMNDDAVNDAIEALAAAFVAAEKRKLKK